MLPYDLQANGEWTWSKFEELCEVLTRYLVDGLDVRDLTQYYPFVEKTPEACVNDVWDSWQELIDAANGAEISENGGYEVKK